MDIFELTVCELIGTQEEVQVLEEKLHAMAILRSQLGSLSAVRFDYLHC